MANAGNDVELTAPLLGQETAPTHQSQRPWKHLRIDSSDAHANTQFSRPLNASRSPRSSSAYAIFTCRAIVLILAVATFSAFTLYAMITDSLPFQLTQNTPCPAECVPDPFLRPGYLYTDENDVSQTRWLVYPFSGSSAVPVHENSEDIDFTFTPPEEMVRNSAPQYLLGAMRGDYSNLNFLTNQTLLIIGSSHDRNNIKSVCSWMDGSVYISKGDHEGGRCFHQELNFNIVLWFSTGVDDHAESSSNLEANVRDLFMPWMREWDLLQPPTIMLFGALFWNEHLLNEMNRHHGLETASPFAGSELMWLRSRVFDLVTYIKNLWPKAEVPMMFRTRHLRVRGEQNRVRHIAQVDGALRSVAEVSAIKLFEWGSRLEGFREMYDHDQHFEMHSPAMWLAGDMFFFYLHRASIPGCWQCRGAED